MSERKYYCVCEDDGRFETMTKEQILAAIAQATGVTNVDPDAGFISKVKETNGGQYVTFWVGTQAEYNEIETKATNCLYIITDDTTKADFEKTAASVIASSEKAAATAAEAKAAAAEATAAANKMGLRREANKIVDDYSAVDSITIDSNASLFYVIEIVNVNSLGSMPERYSITLDYYQVASQALYYVPGLNVTIGGHVQNKKVTITIANFGNSEQLYKLTRVVGYY